MKKITAVSFVIFILSATHAQNCPGISVEPNAYELPAGDTLTFTAAITDKEAHVTYNWSISAGTILSGQGTARILVETKKIGGMSVTATVELMGLPAKCTNTTSATAEIIPAAQLVASGTFRNGQDLKNAVQQFITASGIKDFADIGTGFIYLYKTAKTTASAFNNFKSAIVSAFEYNKILPSQYKIAEGGQRKLAYYEFYLIGPNGKEPAPSK